MNALYNIPQPDPAQEPLPRPSERWAPWPELIDGASLPQAIQAATNWRGIAEDELEELEIEARDWPLWMADALVEGNLGQIRRLVQDSYTLPRRWAAQEEEVILARQAEYFARLTHLHDQQIEVIGRLDRDWLLDAMARTQALWQEVLAARQ